LHHITQLREKGVVFGCTDNISRGFFILYGCIKFYERKPA
jgi:hypothetical protein